MNPEMAKALRLWKMKTIYNHPASGCMQAPAEKGKQPYWPKFIYRVYIKRASSGQNWLTEADRMAHLPSYVWDDPECQWRESQCHSGTSASCQFQGHDGHLCPSCDVRKA